MVYYNRWVGVLSATVLVSCAGLLGGTGCTQQGDPQDVGEADGSRMGVARLSVQAAPVLARHITRVTVTAQSGPEVELARDPEGNFTGTLLLPEGSNQLVGRAFVDDQLVGSSAPVPVEIQAGGVTQASLRILDVTAAQDVAHSPIVLSLTYPLAAVVNQPAQLSITAVDPDDDALAVEWTSDCADATFSVPTSFVTEFTRPSAGACNVSVSVSDGELSASETFSISVFEESHAQGAVNVNGQFVVRPIITVGVEWSEMFCGVDMHSMDGTCPQPITTPEAVRVHVGVNWGNSPAGTVEFTDSCGGAFGIIDETPTYYFYWWRPPTHQAVCSLGALATNGDGVSSQLSAAVLVRPEPAE